MHVFDVSGYREALICVLFSCSRLFTFCSTVTAVIIGWADTTKLGTRLAATSKACTDVGVCDRPPCDPPSPRLGRTPRIFRRSFFSYSLFYRLTDTTVPFRALVLRCAFLSIRLGQFGFAGCVAVFSFRLLVESWFFFFVF